MTKLCVTLLIFLCVSKTLQHIPLEFFGNLSNKGTNVGSLSKSEPVKSPALNIKLNVENQLKNVTNNLKQNNFALSSDVQLNKGNTSYMTSIEPGADLRLLSVIISFIALSCLLFVGCRIYRYGYFNLICFIIHFLITIQANFIIGIYRHQL